ncbi:hypothetical protein SCHPADRAFT_198455 [Schizopora paradoxa]|uniref:Uncharacterized protein n=1 Tax=Schizopora paradoxa TaxID=27342 RepID=A0A0H2RYB9_9AGAM|nr:hypothetical protein SCHPADRAFT_198455 [Schizopora paradoxa]
MYQNTFLENKVTANRDQHIRTSEKQLSTPLPNNSESGCVWRQAPIGVRNASTCSRRRPYFEATDWVAIMFHSLAVGSAYPFLYLVCFFASDRTLFWSRLIVRLGSGILAFALGRTPFFAARKYLEATTWATFIHESTCGSRDGLPISVLAERTDKTMCIFASLKLLYRRNLTNAVSGRREFDRTPWSLVAIFFLFLVFFSSTLDFIFGRIVNIEPFTQRQYTEYEEVPIFGDLSDIDVLNSKSSANVMEGDFALTWTLMPFGSLASLPNPVFFHYGNDTIYFAETYVSQLLVNGTGIGTFSGLSGKPVGGIGGSSNGNIVGMDEFSSSAVQFPKWGIRIACSAIDDIESFMVPVSNVKSLTYVFVPRLLVQQLYGELHLQIPNLPSPNMTEILYGDSINITVDSSAIVAAAKFSNNGVAHSLFSSPVDMGGSGSGWTTIEVVSTRINDTYTPSGTFPLYGDPMLNATGSPTRIGYDAAVCVEAYEPWIVESINSTMTGMTPTSNRVVRSGAGFSAGLDIGAGVVLGRLPNVTRQINSSGKGSVYSAAHDNSINQMLKDNGRDFWYVPSPMMVSFSGGSGASGYKSLSASQYATARATADATNVLPYLAGSKQIVGRRYQDLVFATASVNDTFAVITLGVIFVVGIISASCVPRLPLGVPRRGFDLLSWLSVLYGDNLSAQLPIDMRKGGLGEKVDTMTTKGRIGNVRLFYAPLSED